MNSGPVFISHASKDDAFVKELRQFLEGQGISVWADSRNLRGGAKLAPEIEQAIETAQQVLVVLSPNTINSSWVRTEIKKALQIERQHGADGYRVIPLLLPGVEPTALALWFKQEPVGIPIRLNPGSLSAALPAILAALGERLPDDPQPLQAISAAPMEELLLQLVDPKIQTKKGERRVSATATLTYTPAQAAARAVESKRYKFTAPLGPIEAEEMRWYLEQYHLWPVGVFKTRAEQVEANLPKWGQKLYEAALGAKAAQEALTAWRDAAIGAERRFSVEVDSDPPDEASAKQKAAVLEAASGLLSLPWELLHDGRSYLGQGQQGVRVRRRLPNRHQQPLRLTRLPIRILLVSPRPEDAYTGYFDHRSSALPLVEAVEELGDLAELTVLNPPTFPALEKALRQAAQAGQPFDVIHFDGHGVYDREHGLGGLCFEDPKDSGKLVERAMELIHAETVAAVSRDHRIPLVFLDACQTAMIEADPTASVAARLLEEGVTSVVAMSHSVLVETARGFVRAFYGELAQGSRVGQAMLAGQRALQGDTYRGQMMGAGELRLQDWFVPVLYQEQQDPQLVTQLPPDQVRQLQVRQRRLSLGELPDPPPQTFIGRSRELLALERLLHTQPYAVVRGQGGVGKTTLAVELARWLVRSSRFERAAFVSLETVGEARAVLDSLGRQLLPGGAEVGQGSGGAGEQGGISSTYSVAQYTSLKEALQPVERALRDQPTLIVLDNLESILPDPANGQPAAAPVAELFDLCQTLLRADPATRLLFTSRERLPAPFDQRDIELGPLSRTDAIKLVEQVLARQGLAPAAADPGQTPQEIADLVEAVHGHARALVLLAPEISRRGVRTTTENIRQVMTDLNKKHPGDRQNSLYASVELSLRRLPPELREQANILAPFQSGANAAVIAIMLDAETAPLSLTDGPASALASALIEVGLAQAMDYGHLRLDPALPAYLWAGQVEQEQVQTRWAEGMRQLANFLYKQQFQDAQLARRLTLLELLNLLALLHWVQGHAPPEQVVELATRVEQLLAKLGQPQALARVVRLREQAARALSGWNHTQYLAAAQNIDRLLERGDLQMAYTTVQYLLQQSLAGGEVAYLEAAYDIGMVYSRLGRVLQRSGQAEAALTALAEAQRRFETLAEAGNASAAGMVSVAIADQGECLIDLGRLEDAAVASEEAIRLAEKLNDQRQVATGKFQLGSVQLYQQRYAEALEIYSEARQIFERLGEPNSVASIWHQIGMIHKRARQFEPAERAYRQALAIKVQQKNRASEASSLSELGYLYDNFGRLEEAITFYRQATDITVELKDLYREGLQRSNIAHTLLKLRRYDEARRELNRAIECNQPFGHTAEPWKTWDILYDLEQASGNIQAAAQARQQAIEAYLAYRRAGGESHRRGTTYVCTIIAQAIQQGEVAAAVEALPQLLSEANIPQIVVPKLQAILAGERIPALADDPNLNYQDVVELRLLLEELGEG